MTVGDTLQKRLHQTMSATEAPPTIILDENGKVPNAPHIISGGMTRAHVPSCDRRIVFSAIDGQLNAAKIALREKNNANDEQPHTAAKVEFFVDCIERTCESLKRQIDIATVPVDEMRVEGAVDSLRTRLLSLATRPSNDGDRGGSSPSSSPSSVDDDASDEIYEFEDDDIVDRDAYDQVKRLRAQARDVSSRVIAIREETTGKALDMTRRDLSELLRVHGFSEVSAEGRQSEEVVEDANATRMDSLNPMRAALQTLVSSMQHVDPALAEKLEALRETIGTIDSSVEKYKRLSQGDDSGLSQTEKALLSIEHQEEYEAHSLGEEETESPMNPDRKLARLLAGVL